MAPAQAASPSAVTSVAAGEPDRLAVRRALEPLLSLPDSGDTSFGGLRVKSDGSVEVSVAGKPSARLTDLIAAVPGGRVTVRKVAHSWGSLTSLTKRLDHAEKKLRDRGIDLSSWGPGVEENAVVVMLKKYSKAQESALKEEFAGEPVSVELESGEAAAASRTDDDAPWWGGSVIRNTLTCTSGFGVNSSTATQYFISAAHCGYTVGSTYSQNGTTFGTVKSFMWGGANADAVLIRTPGGNTNTIFADPTTPYRSVSSVAASDAQNDVVCTGGAVSKEVCNVNVDRTGQSVTYNNHTVHNLVRAHAVNGQKAFCPGNSGGPVYTGTGGTGGIAARGLVSAYFIDNGVTRCDIGWYSAIRYITSGLGVSVRVR
jgi:hypothetical protein